MNADELAQRVLARIGRTKTAGMNLSPVVEPDPSNDSGASGQKRDIPKDHNFNPQSLKPMAKALWATSVSLGHALTAYRHLSRLKSVTVSPDGKLGGQGYIMDVKDARLKMHEACEALSAIADTLHDEIEAPHWKPRLAMLDESDAKEVGRFIEKSEKAYDQAEDDSEDEMGAIEDGDDEEDGKKGPASEMPSSGAAPDEFLQKESQKESPKPVMKQANSTIQVDALPGPRVNHIGPGAGDGPFDSYNPWEDGGTDSWSLSQGSPDVDAVDAREATGPSALPSDDTNTEAWDFGLGFGARGQGAGGYANPSGEGDGTKGVWGPHSGLPGSPAGSSGDNAPTLDLGLEDRRARISSLLPNDQEPPVARSDYYQGDKGNIVSSPRSTSELPGELTLEVDNAPSLEGTYYIQEDTDTPYIRYDYTTHTLREDPLHPSQQGTNHG